MSSLYNYLPQSPIVLDSSALINLLGTDQCLSILQALDCVILIESRTIREITRHPIPGRKHEAELRTLIVSGAMAESSMSDDEYAIFLSLIQGGIHNRLDDGEAAALALASRGHAIVLDENKARKVAAAQFPKLNFCSTTKLMLTAGKRAGWTVEAVQQLVLAARVNAKLGVPRDEREFVDTFMAGVQGW